MRIQSNAPLIMESSKTNKSIGGFLPIIYLDFCHAWYINNVDDQWNDILYITYWCSLLLTTEVNINSDYIDYYNILWYHLRISVMPCTYLYSSRQRYSITAASLWTQLFLTIAIYPRTLIKMWVPDCAAKVEKRTLRMIQIHTYCLFKRMTWTALR